jgi:hypothetical protein
VRDAVVIISPPDKLHPRYVTLPIELVKKFDHESLVLESKVDYAQTSLAFWLAHHIPGRQGLAFFFSINIFSP